MGLLRALTALLTLASCSCKPHGSAIRAESEDLAAHILESTVKIHVAGGGHGAGFFCFQSDYVCTAAHVVETMPLSEYQIERYGKTVRCSIVHATYSPDTDAALLKVDCFGHPLMGVAEATRGREIMAAGHPFNVEWNTSFGHITTEHQRILGQDMFVFDAHVNPGNSGGPIVDMQGNLVGIVNALRTNDGMFGGLAFGLRIEELIKLVR